MWRPGLDKDHVASQQTSSICSRLRVGPAPEDNSAIIVHRIREYLVQLNCESVQVANVKWAEVRMEAVVEECIIDGEVYGWMDFGTASHRQWSILGFRRAL